MKTLYFVSIIIIKIVFTTASISDCGSELATVNSVEVTGCDESDARCVLRRNSNVTVKISFTAKKNIEQVKAVVHGIVMGVPVPFALPNDNGCSNSDLTCPLQEGQSYEYETTLPVLKKYPRVTVEVKWELVDEQGKDITCSLIPAKIQ